MLPVLATAVCTVPSASPTPHTQANSQHMLRFNTQKHPLRSQRSLAVVPPVNKRSAQGTVRPISRRKHLGLNDVCIFICGQLTFPRKLFAISQCGETGLSGKAEQGRGDALWKKEAPGFLPLPSKQGAA